MTTAQTKKVNTNTVNRLNSTNTAMVLKTIEELREAGNSAYIPFLVEVLYATNNPEIKSNIHRLFAELKHRDAIPLLVEAVKNEKYAGERARLVSACWENGLDYSADLPLFVDLVIANDLVVAFEAYTVVTNMSGKISGEIIDNEVEKIKKAMIQANEQKKELLHDLVHFLPAFKEGIEPHSF
jgi:hypothetical protein